MSAKPNSPIKYYTITGMLQLTNPALLGNGESELTDMDLIRDLRENRPLLTGSSLAGALRSYLNSVEQGFAHAEGANSSTTALFGSVATGDGGQSALIVADALGSAEVLTEVRDGVKLDPKTRTAEDKAKYDAELLPAGTIFPLRLELQIYDAAQESRLLEALVAALGGLERGEIAIGAKRTRGWGRCKVAEWTVISYNLGTKAGLLAWLGAKHGWQSQGASVQRGTISSIFPKVATLPDLRTHVTFRLECAIDGAILIRGPVPLSPSRGSAEPDTVHLGGPDKPFISGSSLAGALRGRALRIVNTLGRGRELMEALFGPEIKDKKAKGRASRLWVHDAPIREATSLVQSHVAIDRFTGGAHDTALFSVAPSFGGTTTLEWTLRKDACQPGKDANQSDQDFHAGLGLLLLLVKDLWTSDLPLGGTIGVGRGRLIGRKLSISGLPDSPSEISISADAQGRLQIDPPTQHDRLEDYVRALQEAK